MKELQVDEWKILEGLRSRFLRAEEEIAPYWNSEHELEIYAETLAQRISWKIQSVLSDLKMASWNFAGDSFIDFGCGSGIMSETFLENFEDIQSVHLFDHSRIATEYAKKRLLEKWPKLRVSTYTEPGALPGGHFILGSHFLGELPDKQFSILMSLLELSSGFLIVEAGTKIHSTKLAKLREYFKRSYEIIGPCPHSEKCPMLTQEKHWCHNFAHAPSSVFQDGNWAEFAKRLKIDLRTLPYSFLAMEKNATPQKSQHHIGRARVYKGYVSTLWCTPEGTLEEKDFSKSKDKADFKRFKKDPSSTR